MYNSNNMQVVSIIIIMVSFVSLRCSNLSLHVLKMLSAQTKHSVAFGGKKLCDHLLLTVDYRGRYSDVSKLQAWSSCLFKSLEAD